MKHILTIISLTLFTIIGISQKTSIKVKFTETIHYELPDNVKAMNQDIPTSGEVKKILFVKGNEAMYTLNKEDKEEEIDDLNGNKRRRRWKRMMAGSGFLYQNRADNVQLDQKDMFGKTFVIEEPLNDYKWKVIATEQRDILGYTCMKAEFQDTSQLITAWFTPQIPISYGPDAIGGLPGLILAVSKGTDRIILATEINLDVENVVIDQPSTKKTVTRKDYETMREEKMEERKAMWGGRGRR
jgi:GLPGLI family protein